MNNTDTVMAFIEAINNGDIETMANFMDENHTFTDSHGKQRHGKTNMTKSWQGFFGLFPDYHIEVDMIMEKGQNIAIFGQASGTYKNFHDDEDHNYFKHPSCWRAEMVNGKIVSWNVYCDTKVTHDIIKSNTQIGI
jgi:ketosteroid isomerase-like protein